MPKYDRPFCEGQPGKVYEVIYSEAKTGYEAAKAANLSENKAYQFKDRYEELFKEVDDGMIARVDPILQAIENDLDEIGESLTDTEIEALESFLDTTWRDVYGNALDDLDALDDLSENFDLGPYELLQRTVGDAYSLLIFGDGQAPDIASDDMEILRKESEVEVLEGLASALQATFQLDENLITKLSQLPHAQESFIQYKSQLTSLDLASELDL